MILSFKFGWHHRISSKKKSSPVGLDLMITGSRVSAYPTELAWLMLVSLRLLGIYIVMLYGFYVNNLSPKSGA